MYLKAFHITAVKQVVFLRTTMTERWSFFLSPHNEFRNVRCTLDSVSEMHASSKVCESRDSAKRDRFLRIPMADIHSNPNSIELTIEPCLQTRRKEVAVSPCTVCTLSWVWGFYLHTFSCWEVCFYKLSNAKVTISEKGGLKETKRNVTRRFPSLLCIYNIWYTAFILCSSCSLFDLMIPESNENILYLYFDCHRCVQNKMIMTSGAGW